MRFLRSFAVAVILGVLTVSAFAADTPRRACLNKDEQRAAQAAGQAIPLAQAIRALRTQGRRADVVRARLCRGPNGLVYLLTLLARNGKVTQATLDAANGNLIGGR